MSTGRADLVVGAPSASPAGGGYVTRPFASCVSFAPWRPAIRLLTVPDPATKLAAQITGLGVGFLPEPVALSEAKAGHLVAKQVAEPKPSMPTHLAWRADHKGKALEWFVAALENDDVAHANTSSPA